MRIYIYELYIVCTTPSFYVKLLITAMVAPELKQNTEADTEITKTCAVLGCEESKNLNSDSFFR